MGSLLRYLAVAVVVSSSFSCFGQTFSFGNKPISPQYVPGQVLVRFRPGKAASAKLSAHARANAVVRRQFAIVPDLQLVSVSSTRSVESAIAAYRSDPDVLYAEPNYIRHTTQSPANPNDPLFPNLWGLHNSGADGGIAGADIKAPEAWAISKGSKNVVVAVIDSGIDYTHPDLTANVWNNTADCNNNGVDDDGDGYADDCHGIDTANDDSDPMDDHGHGTHVAGTIGAVGNNSVGVVGVNWTTTIIGCKFLSYDGYGSDSDAIDCLAWLATLKQRGVNIVATNNSWGGGGYSDALYDAIKAHRDLGILFIAAAGNAFTDNDGGDFYPSNYALSNIISVAATTRTDALADFSDFGRHTVHIGAPGDHIESTYPGNRYAIMSGTSMATPHVTGTVALLAAAHPELDWKALKNRIIASGDPIPSLQSTITGRRLNAKAALTCTDSEVLAPIQPYEEVVGTVGHAVGFSALHINCEAPAGPVTVTIEPGGNSVILTDDGEGTDQTAGDGIYSGFWMPTTAGIYTYTLAGETGKVIVDPYAPSSTAMQWRDISSVGIGMSLGTGFGWNTPLTLPFPVSLAGRGIDTLAVSVNGMLSAPANWMYYPPTTPLPTVEADILIAPFAEMLSADGWVNTRNVFWGVLGQAPNRELVIEWRDMPHASCSNPADGGVTFQVVLFEDKPDVLYNYKDVSFGGNCASHDAGATANVGLQPAPGSAVEYSFQQPKLADNTAVLWRLASDYPANPVPTLTSMLPPYFVTTNYFSGAYLLARGTNFQKTSLFLMDDAPRAIIYGGANVARVLMLNPDLAHARTAKAAMFNALPGGGKSAPLDYEIKPQDFTLQLASNTVDLTSATSGFTTVTMLPAPAVIDPVTFTCTTSDARLSCAFSVAQTFGGFEAPVVSQLNIQRTVAASATLGAGPEPPQRRPSRAPFVALITAAGLSVVGLVQVWGSRRRLAAMLILLVFIAGTQFACGGGGGTSTPPPPPLPTAILSATPATIGAGQAATLTWSTTNATTITMDGETVAASGTKSVTPAATTTYHLLAKGAGGSKEAVSTVTVINTTTATVTVKVYAAGVERTATVTVIMPA